MIITEETVFRALSWRNPFAVLMLPPFNKIETRTWLTRYRGPVLLCCTKAPYNIHEIVSLAGNDNYLRIKKLLEQHKINPEQYQGKAFAIGNLVDCVPMERIHEELAFVNYHPELFAHIYEDVQPIKLFQFSGKQGWGKVTEEIKSQIEFL